MDVAAAVTEECVTNGLRHNCITERVETHVFEPLYDNGYAGSVDSTNFTKPYQTWPATWTPTGQAIPDGVKLGPFFEAKVRLFGAYNITALENRTDLPYYTDALGLRVRADEPAVRALRYTVRLNATDVMSGSSDYYFRSAVAWSNETFARHYLNVFDPFGRVVVADRYDPARSENNLTSSMLHDDRVYYHLSARFDTGVDYTFIEYLNYTAPYWGLGVDYLDVHAATNQDIDGDGRIGFILFPGEVAQRTFSAEMDLAYSFRFVYGQGPGGTMNLLEPDGYGQYLLIQTGAFLTRNASSTQNQFTLTIPLRTTFPLNGTLTVAICPDYATYLAQRATDGCGPTGYASVRGFTNVTGSIREVFTYPGPQTVTTDGPHYAKVKLLIDNFVSRKDDNGEEQHLLSYPMYTDMLPDGNVGTHVVQRIAPDGETIYEVQPYAWTMWAEVVEEQVPFPRAVSVSDNGFDLLSPVNLFRLGAIILAAAVLLPGVNIPLLFLGGALIAIANVQTNGEVWAIMKDEFGKIITPAWEFVQGATLAAVCTGAVLAPAVGAGIGAAATRSPKGAKTGALAGAAIGRAVQPAALAGCGLLATIEAGLLPELLRLIMHIPEILKTAVDVVGHLASEALRAFLAVYDALLPWALLFLYAMGILLTVWLCRETALVVFAWLILLFLAMRAQPAVDVLRRGEMFARMLPVPLWDNRMKKMGALRGTYYRDEVYRNNKGV